MTYLTTKDLAQRWKVGVKKIYRMKNRGEIPFARFGGAIRFPLAAIEAYERTQTTTPEEGGNQAAARVAT